MEDGFESELVEEDAKLEFPEVSDETENAPIEDKSKDQLECPMCDESFYCEFHRNQHMKKHKNEEPPHSCEVCSRKFFLIDKLLKHKCTLFNKIKCYICGDKEFRSTAFSNHLRDFHKNDQSFDCKLCPKKCRFAKTLNNHIRVFILILF